MRNLLIYLATGLCLLSTASATESDASTPDGWFAAARIGDVEEIRRLLENGTPIDSGNRYGATAILTAASNGQLEIVRLLLAKGADADRAETFYGSNPVGAALYGGHLEVAKLLLETGAAGRDMALDFGVRERDSDLARAAIESGPFLESTLERLRTQPDLEPEIGELLKTARSRPDPKPPEYSAEELRRFAKRFEGWTSDTTVVTEVRDGQLVLAIDQGEPILMTVAGDRFFRSEDGQLEARFSGRAGTVEGVRLRRGEGSSPETFRETVAQAPDPEEVQALTEHLAALADPGSVPATVNWPGFRGPRASGIGDGLEPPTSWNLETGEGVLWQAPVPGLGNSSPVVWEDRVFVTTAVAESVPQKIRTGLTGDGSGVDESVEHSWRALAFDKLTGRELWSTEIGRGVPLTRRHFKATQANSTPVTDGRYLVAVFPTAGLACLDLDGKVLWKHDLGGLNAGAFTDPGIEWGYASSPMIYKTSVILQVDVHGGSYLAAWDLETGRELWRTARDVAPSWATPNLLRGPDGDELVVNGSTIHGYDPATGKELWSLGPNSELVIATPVVDKNIVYVSAGYPPVKPIYAVRAGTRGHLEVTPGTAHDRLLWSHGRGGAYMPTPLLYRGLFYVVHHNGRLVAYEPKSGHTILKQRFSRGGTFTASPIAANGKVYAGTEEGLLYVLAAGAEYQEIAVHDFEEPLMATPALSEGILLMRTPTRLLALKKEVKGP